MTKKKVVAVEVQTETPLRAFKGFDANWQCHGFQFDVGKTYTEDKAELCKSGFHACEYPLDILNYYPPTGKMAEVELSGLDEKSDTDTKRAAKTITIKASLTVPMIIAAAFEYTVTRCDPVKAQHSKGYRSASSATGDQSASSATGYRSASSATGDRSASSATGDNAIAAAFGLESKAKAGETGVVVVSWWDGKRKRLTVGYVGENGIKPDVFYSCDKAGNLREVN